MFDINMLLKVYSIILTGYMLQKVISGHKHHKAIYGHKHQKVISGHKHEKVLVLMGLHTPSCQ